MHTSWILTALVAPLQVLAATNAANFAQIQSVDRARRAQNLAKAKANLPYFEWRPAVESKVQMILAESIDANYTVSLVPHSAQVFDIDLFNNDARTIAAIKARGHRVICYFSAGTAENWRPDFKKFTPAQLGKALPDWPGERWLDNRDPAVRQIMFERIRLAWWNGCDAVDPDNIDVYSNEKGGGFHPPITKNDSIRYVRDLAYTAHLYGLGMGLKNADEILPHVQDVLEFAVNEECMTYNGSCSQYEPFVNPKEWYARAKPVYHVEYVSHTIVNGTNSTTNATAPTAPIPAHRKRQIGLLNPFALIADLLKPLFPMYGHSGIDAVVDADKVIIANENYPNLTQFELRKELCGGNKPALGRRLNTIIKAMNLGGWVMYCDGEVVTTVTRPSNNGHIDAPANYNATTGAVASKDDDGSDSSSGNSTSPDAASVAGTNATAAPFTNASTTDAARRRFLGSSPLDVSQDDILFAPFDPLPAEHYAESRRKTEEILNNYEKVMDDFEAAANDEDGEAVYVHPAWRYANNRGARRDVMSSPSAQQIVERRQGRVAVSFGR